MDWPSESRLRYFSCAIGPRTLLSRPKYIYQRLDSANTFFVKVAICTFNVCF